jgi:hypothetical protein
MSGTWKPLTHQPTFAASTMLLLTDGTVMCQQSGGVNWSRLTPDATGDYAKGTWSALAPMINTRLYYASAVLRDGRVIACGGEYSNAGSETNKCEMYDPLANTWSQVTPPAGWTGIGDAASVLLPDGRLLMGYYSGAKTAIYDPVAGTWTAGPTKGASASEETWTLLPDQTVLTVQCSNTPHAEKYVAAANQWVSAGTLPVNLVETSSLEIGPACLLPDGRALCLGATNKTAYYTPPPIASQAGTWSTGPQFPDIGGKNIGAKDAPACLLPNGKVLCAVGPVDGLSGSYLSPTYFFEIDGSTLTQISNPPGSTIANGVPYAGRMMMLPTGQLLFAAGTNEIQVYTPDGQPEAAWRPAITSVAANLRAGFSYTLFGRQLNGLSQTVAYGDDASSATNYPLVRIRHLATNRMTYCRTSDHSTMGVATGTAVHHTTFLLPSAIPTGASEITVVANGISSSPVSVNVQPRFHIDPHLVEIWAWLFGSLADGPLWVWGPHGPVPVDPWGPKIAREAKAARATMLSAMREMMKLGQEVVALQQKAADAVPPSVDLEATEAEADGRKKSSQVKSAKR